jgi:MFS family permease
LAEPHDNNRFPEAGAYRWAVVGMLWLVCLLIYADRQAIFSVFPPLRTELHVSKVQLGVVGSAFMWVYALASPLAGFVGDRVRRKLLILGGLAFWSVVTLLTALARTYPQLVSLRALEGLGEAFYMPASVALISAYHGPRTRSRALALHQSSVYGGTVLGGAVAGFCAEHYGWRSGFLLFGGLGTVLAAALVPLLREPAVAAEAPGAGRGEDASPARAAAELLGNGMVLLLMAVFVGANFVAMIFLTWMPSYLHERFGMDLAMSGLNATLWLQAASVLGVLCGGYLADRWARRRRGGRMAVQALGLFAGAPLIFLTGWTLSVPVLVVALAGFGFCKGLYDANIWASLYDVVPARRRATALGLMNAVGWLGGSAAPVAVAVAAGQFGMGIALQATSVIYLLFGCLLVLGVVILSRPASVDKIAGPLPTEKLQP